MQNHNNYNCKVTLEDGNEHLVYANWIHNNSLDHWKGWHCEAGITRLHINKDLEVYSGECLNEHLGSALDNFKLLNTSICHQARCTGCSDDLMAAKYKP